MDGKEQILMLHFRVPGKFSKGLLLDTILQRGSLIHVGAVRAKTHILSLKDQEQNEEEIKPVSEELMDPTQACPCYLGKD